jgi:hypothetical protein
MKRNLLTKHLAFVVSSGKCKGMLTEPRPYYKIKDKKIKHACRNEKILARYNGTCL